MGANILVLCIKWEQQMGGKYMLVVLADRRTAETMLIADEQMPEVAHLEQFTQVLAPEMD